MVASPTRPAPVTADPDLRRTPAGRTLSKRRGLPGARAVIGGLLVVIAVVGTFLAYQRATAPHMLSYVVAAHDIRPGAHIQASDLTTRRIDLPDSLRGRVYASTAEVEGAVTLGPIEAGDLVQRSLVNTSASNSTANLVSFSVSPDHAVEGDLQPGDRIAIVSSDNKTPTVVASDLKVIDVNRSSSSLGGGTQLTITVSADGTQAVGVAYAATNAENVVVVRMTGVPSDNWPTATTPSSGSSGNGP